MLGIVLAVLAGLGVCWRRRWPFALVIVLCLCGDLRYLLSVSLANATVIWLWQLPVSATQILLLWAIYRRASRSGVLLPGHSERSFTAPSGDDILWLCRCMGIYLLLSAAVVAYLIFQIWLDRNTLHSSWQACPILHSSIILLAGAEVLLGIGIILRRYWLLIVCAALAALAPLLRDLASRWDFTHNPAYSGIPTGLSWQDLLSIQLLSMLTAGFYLVLYRKARGRTSPETALGTD